jgi:tight adherence protein C
MTLLLVVGIVMLFAAVLIVAELATVPARQRRESIVRATRQAGGLELTPHEVLPSLRERVLMPLAGAAARLVLRVSPKTSLEAVDRRLLSAGLAPALSAPGFLATKLLGVVVGVVVGALVGSALGSGFRAFVFAVALGAAGFILPDRLLTSRVRNRRDRIQSDLPDALDLLAVSVEAGLGLDGAIAQLIDHMKGPLVDEFALTLGEMRIGETRTDALKKLAERVDVPEMTSLTRAIIQSDQLGISLGRILRLQARDTRIRRQNTAEERANKTPIKMLFPTVLFIFPALFFVILGPAFITILKVLKT